MAAVLEQLAAGSRVLVIRLRSLGDCVLTTPALHLLKRTRPDLRIAVAVEDPFRAVYTGNPDVDEILHPSTKNIALWRPALTLNLHGGTRSVVLTAASAARWRAGFAHFRGQPLYNVRIPRAQEILKVESKVHTAEHIASAMFYLGVPRQEIPRASLYVQHSAPEQGLLPLQSRARQQAAGYAVIHPVAATPEKTWRQDGFLAVAESLREDGLHPVFIAGPGEDLTKFSEHECIAGAPLEHTKTLLKHASIFIGNDSGPAHMAAAFGIPVVVLFGNSDPVIWAPWRVESQTIVRSPIQSIETSEVLHAIEQLRVAR